tara:strand:+ start:55 stop:237 length:183 start_codon:yes stop_codon:yes gene_type:complete
MKIKLTGTLGTEYFKDRIEVNEKRIEELDESQSTKHARKLGFYKALVFGLISDLEKHENN